MKRNVGTFLKALGPGIAVAATGVGAGDMVAAAVAGASYGPLVLWAAAVGAAIKFGLNEGIARWQLATGETLLEGWADKLGRWVSVLFGIYLLVWSFMVAGALMAACGLAAHALYPIMSVSQWGIVHSMVAVALVLGGRYEGFEQLMKLFIAMMFGLMMVCAIWVQPDWGAILPRLVMPAVPPGAGKFLLGVIGGVGGSVTLLSYSYWIREKGWGGRQYRQTVQMDLGVAYFLTGLFGVAVMIIAAGVNPAVMTGNQMVLAVAERLGEILGVTAKWIFLAGFWGAVFSSMLGVWQGVPYIFTDFVYIQRGQAGRPIPEAISTESWYYKIYLLYLAVPPMLLLAVNKPVWIVLIYSITGALFMPFLAVSLLYMNNRRDWVGDLKNRWFVNALLMAGLLVFGYLCGAEILDWIMGT